MARLQQFLNAAWDAVIGDLFPAPPTGAEYCKNCGGTGFDKYWKPCNVCHAIGYIETKHKKEH